MKRAIGGLAFLLCALSAAPAAADAVEPPPTDCVEGSIAVDFCHGPPTCEIADCTGDADCMRGQVCRPRDLCIREHCCSGRGCGMPATATFYDHVEAACTGGACDGFGTTCETRRVCITVPVGTDAGPSPEDAGTDAGSAIDAGPVELDAGDSDAGAGDSDAGAADAGAGDSDAGSSLDDAGPQPMDAATGGDGGTVPRVDAGTGSTTDGGCGCHTVGRRGPASSFALALLIVAGFSLRRRSA